MAARAAGRISLKQFELLGPSLSPQCQVVPLQMPLVLVPLIFALIKRLDNDDDDDDDDETKETIDEDYDNYNNGHDDDDEVSCDDRHD